MSSRASVRCSNGFRAYRIDPPPKYLSSRVGGGVTGIHLLMFHHYFTTGMLELYGRISGSPAYPVSAAQIRRQVPPIRVPNTCFNYDGV